MSSNNKQGMQAPPNYQAPTTSNNQQNRGNNNVGQQIPEGADVFEFAGGSYRTPAEGVNFEEKYNFFGPSKKIQYVPNYNEERLKEAAKLIATRGVSLREAARMYNVTQKDLKFYYNHQNNDILQLPKDFDPFGEEDDPYQ